MVDNSNVQNIFVIIWRMSYHIGQLFHMSRRNHLWKGYFGTLGKLMLIEKYLGSVKLWKVVEKITKFDFMGILWNSCLIFGLLLWILLGWKMGILCEYCPYRMVAPWNINAIEFNYNLHDQQFGWCRGQSRTWVWIW